MAVQQQRATITPSRLTFREAGLGEGICGRITGTAIVFDTRDTYDTEFAPGCLDGADDFARSGKMQLFLDHTYGVRTHVGVVRSVTSTSRAATFAADLFDTEDGWQAKAYLVAVTSARALAGVSIGFAPLKSVSLKGGGERFLKVRLEELSITPRPAVNGAEVESVRGRDRPATWEDRRKALATIYRADLDAMRDAWRDEAAWDYRRKVVAELLRQDVATTRRALATKDRQDGPRHVLWGEIRPFFETMATESERQAAIAEAGRILSGWPA